MNGPTQGQNGFMEPSYDAGVVLLVDSNNGISTVTDCKISINKYMFLCTRSNDQLWKIIKRDPSQQQQEQKICRETWKKNVK